MNITSFQLKIRNPQKTIAFYTKTLGMRLANFLDTDQYTIYTLAFQNSQYTLELIHDRENLIPSYTQKPKDNYWKYSLFVNDIQRVFNRLLLFKHPIKAPYQFGEIGYLSHTTDVENHQIEFIQKCFKGKEKPTLPEEEFPLFERPVLGLLTIRTKDPVKTIHFYEEICEMKLLVRMYVDRGNGFTLYFLGSNKLQPPSADIDAIENREWMYQQDHLFIEIQYYWGSEHDPAFTLNPVKEAQAGLNAINFKGNLIELKQRLLKNQIPFKEIQSNSEESSTIQIKTIDGHRIVVT